MGIHRAVAILITGAVLVITGASHAAVQNAKQVAIVSIPKIRHAPLDINGLYRVDIVCHQQPISYDHRSLSLSLKDMIGNIGDVFTDPLVTVAGTLTFSTKQISLSDAPSTDSIFALIPFDDRIQSTSKKKNFESHTCTQSFLINGKNDVFITAVYSKLVTQQPSKLLTIIGAVSGLADPLLNAIPGGAAAEPIIKQIAGAGNPYSTLLSAFNEEDAHIDSDAVGVGNYSVKASNATVQISVTRIQSVLVSGTPSIKRAFEKRIVSVAENVVAHPDTCVREGDKLLRDENYGSNDVAYALSEAVINSGLSLQKMEQCLTSKYGPRVSKTSYWLQNVMVPVSAYDFPAHYDDIVSFDRARIDLFLYDLKHFETDTTTQIDGYFTSGLKIKDFTDSLALKDGASGKDTLLQLKTDGFVSFGCPYDPKDEGYFDAEHRQASIFLLAVKGTPTASAAATAPSPAPAKYQATDAVLLILWWQGSIAAPKIFEVYASQPPDLIGKILTKWGKVCSTTMRFE